MVSLQGFVYNRRRWDAPLGRSLLAELRESQWWTADQFRDYQAEKFHKHILFAQINVPYYAELFSSKGITPRDIRSVDDIARIPFLNKTLLRARPLDFLRGGRPHRSWNRHFTSGTTGSPMNLYTSRESFTRVWSFVFRLREWCGLSDPIYPRRVQFTGRDIVPNGSAAGDGPIWRRNVAGNALLMSTSHLSRQTVPAYVQAMKNFAPELIDGYPSAIAVVARVAQRLGLELPRPRAIITSAETLPAEDRRLIQSAFGCKVFNQYASSDTGAFICDCEHGNLHINPEFGICEILDSEGRPAKPGEEGEIVTTSFCNTEQVFIRYRIGDAAVPGPPDPCPCGRMMPRVEAVTGRVDDVLYIPERGFVGRFDPIFKGLHGIYEARIIHESLGVLRVELVPDPEYNEKCEAALIESLRRKVGRQIGIVVDKVAEIPRGPNGKFRSVTSMCRNEYPEV